MEGFTKWKSTYIPQARDGAWVNLTQVGGGLGTLPRKILRVRKCARSLPQNRGESLPRAQPNLQAMGGISTGQGGFLRRKMSPQVRAMMKGPDRPEHPLEPPTEYPFDAIGGPQSDF